MRCSRASKRGKLWALVAIKGQAEGGMGGTWKENNAMERATCENGVSQVPGDSERGHHDKERAGSEDPACPHPSPSH